MAPYSLCTFWRMCQDALRSQIDWLLTPFVKLRSSLKLLSYSKSASAPPVWSGWTSLNYYFSNQSGILQLSETWLMPHGTTFEVINVCPSHYPSFYLSESMRACDWLQVCLSGCRLSPGADWFQPGRQGFKGRLLPVPVGLSSSALQDSQHLCDCGQNMLKLLLLVVIGEQEEESLTLTLRPRPWS